MKAGGSSIQDPRPRRTVAWLSSPLDLLCSNHFAWSVTCQDARPRHHGIEHGLGEPAGEGVLLAGVVAAEEEVATNGGLDAMAEARPAGCGLTQGAEHAEGTVPGEPAEADDHPRALQDLKFFRQV